MTASGKLILRSKCVVLGNAGVGKSALVQMFHSDGTQYPKTYAMTIHCDVCVKIVNIPDTDVTVELFIHDVGGNEIFQEFWPRYLEGATSFILMYDTTNADSFKALSKWLGLIQKVKPGKPGFNQEVLVASKVDQTLRRAITTQQGEEFAKANGLAYFECSSAENVDVEAPFYFVSSALHESFEESINTFNKAVGL